MLACYRSDMGIHQPGFVSTTRMACQADLPGANRLIAAAGTALAPGVRAKYSWFVLRFVATTLRFHLGQQDERLLPECIRFILPQFMTQRNELVFYSLFLASLGDRLTSASTLAPSAVVKGMTIGG
jgi:hypothetical protein